MQATDQALIVVIGSGTSADVIRRRFLKRQQPHVGVTSSLRGLRRCLVADEIGPVVLLISLDQATLRRYGESLRQLLADQPAFGGQLTSIGLVSNCGFDRESVESGCDLFVESLGEALDVIELLVDAPIAQPESRGSRFNNVPRRAIESASRQTIGHNRNLWLRNSIRSHLDSG